VITFLVSILYHALTHPSLTELAAPSVQAATCLERGFHILGL